MNLFLFYMIYIGWCQLKGNKKQNGLIPMVMIDFHLKYAIHFLRKLFSYRYSYFP